MKKVIGSILILGLFLVGCSTNTVKTSESTPATDSSSAEILQSTSFTNETTESTIVENAQESRPPQEILDSLTSDTNKKITQAFLDADLKMYGNTVEGPGENPSVAAGDPNGYPESEKGMSFYTTPGTEGLIITIENFSTVDLMEQVIPWRKENNVFPVITIVKNENTKSVMFSFIDSESEEYSQFEEYAKVFESVK
jgi:hypothetical protein